MMDLTQREDLIVWDIERLQKTVDQLLEFYVV